MKKLLQQALDALEQCTYDEEGYLLNPDNEEVIEALRTELKKPEPEPVGWATVAQLKRGAFMEGATPPSFMNGLIPLYTKGATNADNR